MLFSRLISTVVLALASTQVAYADWRFAKWGMTSSELVAAAKSASVDLKLDGDYSAIIPTISIAGHEYKAKFYFRDDSHILEFMTICLVERERFYDFDKNKIKSTLIDTFGNPIIASKDKGFEKFSWVDEPRNNYVSLKLSLAIVDRGSEVAENCVLYRPYRKDTGF